MKYKGLYHGSYEVDFSKNQKSAEFKRAFVIPGQGASTPGMFFDEMGINPEFRSVFSLADQISGFFDLLPISHYINSPNTLPKDRIHIYRSCALFCAEVSIGNSFISRKLLPDFITGHSFGECAALVLGGVIDLESMLNVVIHRNLICPAPNELGIMIALTADMEKYSQLTDMPGVFLANRNSDKQIVISVAKESIEAIVAKLRELRIPHIILQQLPQPYHSPLMEPYRVKMERRIRDMKLQAQEPKFPIFSGVSHSWIESGNYKQCDYANILSAQIVEPVNFIGQIEALNARGANIFYEMGPGKMLGSSINSILKGKQISCKDAESLLARLSLDRKKSLIGDAKVKDLSGSNWFGKIKNMIASVTGYQPDAIAIEHSFQNDLGIDSIKKAEILFKLISQENIGSGSDFSITSFNTIYQIVEYLENYSEEQDPLRINYEKKIEVLQPVLTEASLPGHNFSKAAASQIVVLELFTIEKAFTKALHFAQNNLDKKKQVLVLLKLHSDELNLEFQFVEDLYKDYLDFIRLQKDEPISFCLVDSSEQSNFRPLASLWKSLVRERGNYSFKYISADHREITPEIVAQEIALSASKDIVYKNSKRYIREFKAIEYFRSNESPKAKTIVAVGGSRGINFEILKRYSRHQQDRLILIGRSEESEPALQAHLVELKGIWPHFHYYSADARNFEQLNLLIESIHAKFSGIDFLINSTGMEVSELFDQRDASGLLEEFNSKILPVVHLEKIKSRFNIPKLFHFTSVVAHFGNKGQALYSYCNALIECISESSGTNSISWGPWEHVGKTENEGILQRIKEWGISLVAPEEGASIAEDLFFNEKSNPVSIVMDYKDIALLNLNSFIDAKVSPLLGEPHNKFSGVFYKDIYLEKEPFLKDHVILGKTVLPAAYLLAQYFEVSRLQFGRFTALIDFSLNNLVMVENGHCHTKIQCFFRPPHLINIYSFVQHATARLDPTLQIGVEAVPAFVPKYEIDVSRLYHDGVFEFGPKFQLVRKGYLDEKKNVRLDVTTRDLPVYSGQQYFDFHIASFELAFQSITLFTHFMNGMVTLPLGIDKIIFSKDLFVGEKYFIFPKVRQYDEKSMSGDVLFVNERNEVFCKYEGFHVKLHRLDREAATKAVPLQ